METKTNSPEDLNPINLIILNFERAVLFTLFWTWLWAISAYLKEILYSIKDESLYPVSAESIPMNIQAQLIIVLLIVVPSSLLYIILLKYPIEPAVKEIKKDKANDQNLMSINLKNTTDIIITTTILRMKVLG
ncbi:hypothetical protein [Flavobacterium sp.]|uniref:hypothetical protein n=1 Tax=Flavobacterium sp. TaxID=239 RepID=UPI0037500F91